MSAEKGRPGPAERPRTRRPPEVRDNLRCAALYTPRRPEVRQEVHLLARRLGRLWEGTGSVVDGTLSNIRRVRMFKVSAVREKGVKGRELPA